MADPSATPTPWLDLLDEDIPVVDKSGKKLLVKGVDFVDPVKAPAPAAAAPAPAAAAPAPVRLQIDATPSQAPAQAPAPEPAPKVTKDDLGLDRSKDDEDIKRIEALVAKKVDVAEVKQVGTMLDSMVDEAVTTTGAAYTDEDMKRRYKMLISLYFRDLRDALETKSKFTMPVPSGGMGMSDADADKVMADLEKKNAEFHAKTLDQANKEKAQYVAAQTEKVLTAQDSADKEDAARREQAYSGLLQKTGMQTGSGELPAPKPLKEPKMVPVVDLAPKPSAQAAPSAIPVAQAPAKPAAPASAAMPAPAALAAPAPAAKPVMADVKFAPKLTGPVEELRQVQLKDFRRLSKDPREATLKLKDKIDLLEEQSFDVKTAGIKAWQDSEVNKLYLDILRQSLEGKPVIEVINELDAKGLPTLSKAEFDAIMELNRKLRFG